MNRSKIVRVSVSSALLLIATQVPAQEKTTEPIPVRKLAPATVSSTDTLGSRLAVRALSDGRVFVNDIQRFRVVLYDKTLSSRKIVLDSSTSLGGTTFIVSTTQLIPALADSTLYVDFGSRSLLVFDPDGKVAGVMALPKPTDVSNLAFGTTFGTPAMDAKGRLVYRGYPPNNAHEPDALVLQNLLRRGRPYDSPPFADSAPIVRADFDRRATDSLTTVRIAKNSTSIHNWLDSAGNLIRKNTMNPFDVGDSWAALPNGTVAILRAHDYHIDWLDPDGTKRSTPKMPFDWKRLTDEDKQRKINAMKPRYEQMQKNLKPEPLRTPNGMRVTRTVLEVVGPNDVPDYEPPISTSAMKVDLDGNLWIIPRTAIADTADGLRYDVVNSKGKLIERVVLPKGRLIAAFEPGGTVIMTNTQGRVTTIERAPLR